MGYPIVLHHGAVNGVTGSCHQLQMTDQCSVLIDCGLFQGGDERVALERCTDYPQIDFSLEGVKALIITHVHADHVGRLPYLLAAGFRGPILCSEPTAKLLPLILEDAFKLEVSRDPKTVERYLQRVQQQIIALPFDHWFSIEQTDVLTAQIRLQRAGHILGAAYVECDLDYPQATLKRRIVFSGDLGAPHSPFLSAPVSPERADILILESTYGDRLHENRMSRQERLESAIDKALADHGTLLIPAFSMGRTQELLYEIEDILHRKALLGPAQAVCDDDQFLPITWPQVPVILDFPLASRLTKVYRELQNYWNEEALVRLADGRKPLQFEQLITVDSHARHMQTVNYLASTGRPAIVIAGGGMCSSGRIVNYLKAMLADQRHNVLFTGFQAKGTPGAAIQKYGPSGGFVELEGERCMIHAGVSTLGGYSAHADQKDLLQFVSGMSQWPAQIRLVHGEEPARKALAKELLGLYRAQNKVVDVLIPTDVKPFP
ncbi:MBL fold metallo-hydrolase [Pseudomonas sp. 7P_10.2_Bac1]|uniref:MBL fold metallo-hydrolase n=1 Tax=Pseudomonas sp. 7P_10.2_Bac1 TaxID=2971614 RepID=UPI0021C9FF5E|nr:MBL fold metallo-hydrolase [Pseudomonas sp. 7P_10.2_Bac1]MCU1728762.1 MBL fold metallo-hydrolase [Pseudomonas sp. 7P_10.2_Bac1]